MFYFSCCDCYFLSVFLLWFFYFSIGDVTSYLSCSFRVVLIADFTTNSVFSFSIFCGPFICTVFRDLLVLMFEFKFSFKPILVYLLVLLPIYLFGNWGDGALEALISGNETGMFTCKQTSKELVSISGGKSLFVYYSLSYFRFYDTRSLGLAIWMSWLDFIVSSLVRFLGSGLI